VQAIVNAATTERADAISAVETELVEVARHASARDLATVMRRLADAIDGDGGAAGDRQQWERRRLSVSALLDGMHHVEGVLDGEAATITNAALDREMARAHMPGDGRTRSQRRADAWTAICRRDLARDTTSPYLRLLPHANIVVDLTGVPTDLADLVRHEARTLHQLSAATRQRLTCDAQITRVITDGPSQVLDVGRRTRLVPTALWDALVARDRHCQGDGCTRGPKTATPTTANPGSAAAPPTSTTSNSDAATAATNKPTPTPTITHAPGRATRSAPSRCRRGRSR
jgi:hypothetical protein